ncbi:MAG: restriction endonuclease subunit S [Thiomicrorhabdus sp.]|nr:restriction endonuclease subunit S [Thiomicrorhabdus sp.]
MQRYEKYKDSGVEWVGEIPVGWEVKKFKYIYDLVTDKNSSELNLPKIGLENIESGTGKFIASHSIFEGEGIHFKVNDILFGKLRPYLAKVYLAQFEGKAVGDFYVFRCKDRMEAKYSFNLILSKLFIDLTNSSTFGSKMPRVAWDVVANFEIACPSAMEQTTIANYLDRKTAEIDQLIAQKERLVALYEEEKTALINQTVTQGINPKATLKESSIEWLGEIPEHWGVVSLKWVSKIYSGGTPDKSNTDYWFNGTIPWLNSGTVNQFIITKPSEYITENGFQNSSAKWIDNNSLVIALAGQGKTKGMAALVTFKTTCNQSLGIIKVNASINSRYLLYYLRKNYLNIRGLAGEGKRDGLNLEMIGSISIPLFDKQEQTAIVQHIETETARINAKITQTQKIIALQKEYRTALISEVVTGKVKVT